ncbi:MAG: hypothetical protein J1F32_01560 [Erysipelotrichales bacterium]|nr:hypothetical protein [Erysipelotrichales bacterium]
MASNLAHILALFLIIPFILFSTDLIGIQETYTELENVATQVSFKIQKIGYISDDLINEIYQTFHAYLESETNSKQSFGDLIEFNIYKYYVGNFINDGKTLIRIKRTVLIGYID